MSTARLLADVAQAFGGEEGEDAQGAELLDSGALHLQNVGEKSAGAYWDISAEGVRIRTELVMFRRGDLFGVVYSYYDLDRGTVVPAEELASVLDKKMIEFINAQEQ